MDINVEVYIMRVLMITPFYFPILGGTESFISNVTTKLNKMGVPTDIMTFNVDRAWKPWSFYQIKKSELEKVNEVNVIRVSAFTFLPTRILLRTNFIPGKFLEKIVEYDILHFHNDVDITFPLFSYALNKTKIFHCHCLSITFDSYKRNPFLKHIFRKIANVYVAPSLYVFKRITELGIPQRRIRVIPNCIDVEVFHPNESLKMDNLLLYVGRLDSKKGLLTLLEALNYLKTRAWLVVIGPPSRPWFFKKILSLIEKINRKNIHLVTYLGARSPEELVKWYQRATVFVCPSLSESFGIVNLEALSCGTPVVATDVGGTSEVVKHGENGILVPPNNAIRLAEGIQYLLDNENVRRKFGENGRKWVVNNFSSDVVAKRLFQIYKSLM
jgi:glycosyltransferase involved in cell wall biosynthesis